MKGRICVSIAEKTVEGCMKALEGLSFAEVRLDALLENPTKAQVKEIFSKPLSLVATCREGRFSQSEQKEMLVCAIESGAAFVDVELEAAGNLRHAIVEAARKKGCKVIVSHHDFEKTPRRDELEAIVAKCFEAGAEIAKIACMVNSNSDNARLLGLLDGKRKLTVVGMGNMGKITRIAAPLLGAEFTFASIGEGKETAQGQMSVKELENAMEKLGASV